MSFAPVLGISLVIGTAVILGVALVTYLSSLARSAYELKVEMRRDLDDGLKAMEAEVSRSLKWARAELAGEIEKSRAAMLEDLAHRVEDLEARLGATVEAHAAATAERCDALATEAALLDHRLARIEHRLVARAAKPEAVNQAANEAPAEEVATPLALKSFGA